MESLKKHQRDKDRMSSEDLIRAGYKERGEILCSAHGVDHAVLYKHPKSGDEKTLCTLDDLTV